MGGWKKRGPMFWDKKFGDTVIYRKQCQLYNVFKVWLDGF